MMMSYGFAICTRQGLHDQLVSAVVITEGLARVTTTCLHWVRIDLDDLLINPVHPREAEPGPGSHRHIRTRYPTMHR